MFMNQSKYIDIINRCLLLFVFIGVGFSLYNYCNNRSLWADEAQLALNISHKNWIQLLRPLDMNQVAPIGFLFTQKLLINILGDHDWVLRLMPFVAFLISIPLLIRIVQIKFNSDSLAFFTAALFVLNSSILYYSSEVKQYSIDVLITVWIWYTLVKYDSLKTAKAVLIVSMVGVVGVFFSNVAIIILFTSGILLLFQQLIEHKKFNLVVFIPLFFWSISFSVYFLLFIKNHPSKEFMTHYWDARKSFPPHQILSPAFRLFLFRKAQILFSSFSDIRFGWFVFIAFFSIGITSLLKKIEVLFFCIAPLFIHFILSYFRWYPFETRLMLYLIPMMILVFSFGLLRTLFYLQKRTGKNIVFAASLLPLLLLVISISQSLPVQREETKSSIDFISENISGDENVFVYYIANPSYNYYKKDYPLIAAKHAAVFGNWNIHGCGQSFLLGKDYRSPTISDNELLNTSGRFWLLFSGVPESDYFKINGENEETHYIKQFLKYRFTVLKQRSFVGSSCYLVQNTKQ